MYKINYDVPKRSDGQNQNIKGHIVDEETMQKHGFSYNEQTEGWVRFKKVADRIELLIAITDKPEHVNVMILDSYFNQHYNYQTMLMYDNPNPVAVTVHENVQKEMSELMEAGIITGYRLGDYI